MTCTIRPLPRHWKSTGSLIIYKQGGAVGFSILILSHVAMSSAEAECNTGAAASMAISFICKVDNGSNEMDADITTKPTVLMMCNSEIVILITNCNKDIKRLQHYKQRLLYMRQLCMQGE